MESAVRFASVAHVKHFNSGRYQTQEDDAVVADPETELKARRLQLDHVTGTCSQMMVNGVQNPQSRVAVEGS
jgi:hypothetical protein